MPFAVPQRALIASTLLRTLISSAAMFVVACNSPEGSESSQRSPWVQTAWALRTDTLPAPSAPDGLVRGGNAAMEVKAESPFRLRFEVELTAADAQPDSGTTFALQVSRNNGPWENVLARDFPNPDGIATPRVSTVHATSWSNGAEAGDLLNGSDATFASGTAVALDSASAPIASLAGASVPVQTELEWAVVIRRYADSAVTNETGDTFAFRMVDGAGRAIGARDAGDNAAAANGARDAANNATAGNGTATLTLRIPDRLLAGTYVETPGALGPWQSQDGALYFPMEPAETYNVLMMMKSDDFGRTWREMDGNNRPATDDLEGFATVTRGDTIWMLHQVSEATYLHAFAMSNTRDSADRWVIRDELVAEQPEPPTQVAALVASPEGQLTALYGDSLGLRIRVREPNGTWGVERRLDGPEGSVASGVMAVRGGDGRIHVAYTAADATRRDVWYVRLSPDGMPGTPVRIASGVGMSDDDIGAVAPLVHLPETGATVLLYRLSDGLLYSRTVRDNGSVSSARAVSGAAVVQNGADSEQVGADAVVFDGRIIVSVIDEATRDIHIIEGTASASGDISWSSPAPLVEGVNAQWIRGQIVRDTSGAPAYGIVYDAGSNGGSGLNFFVAHQLR